MKEIDPRPITPIPFKVMKSPDHALLVQVDEGEAFYSHLHYHPEYQLTAIVRGEGVLYAGNSMSVFRENDIFMIGSDVPHLLKSNPQSGAVKGISLFFDKRSFGGQFFAMKELHRLRELMDESLRVIRVNGAEHPEIMQAMCATPGLRDEQLVISFLQVLSRLGVSAKEYLNGEQYHLILNRDEGGRLNEVLDFVFSHFQDDIKVEQVARIACLSRSQFSYFFKLHTGKTFIRFLNEYRIEQACLHLKKELLSIEQVAFESGFNNVSHFIRQFKKVKQMSPSAYQRSWRIS